MAMDSPKGGKYLQRGEKRDKKERREASADYRHVYRDARTTEQTGAICMTNNMTIQKMNGLWNS